MDVHLHRVVLILAVFAASAVNAQAIRVNGGGGATFVGGTLTAPLILSATNTLCSQTLSLAYAGDTDTGMQRRAANKIELCVNGLSGLTIGTALVEVADDLSVYGDLDATTALVHGDLTVNDDVTVVGSLVRTSVSDICTAGVLDISPQPGFPTHYIDPDGAACAVTIDDAFAQLNTGSITIIIANATAGGGVTFPNVAGEHSGPTLCTTTGLAQNGVYTIIFADKATDLYLGVSCVQNP